MIEMMPMHVACRDAWIDTPASKDGPEVGCGVARECQVSVVSRRPGIALPPRFDDLEDTCDASDRRGLAIFISIALHAIAISATAFQPLNNRDSPASKAPALTVTLAEPSSIPALAATFPHHLTAKRRVPLVVSGSGLDRPLRNAPGGTFIAQPLTSPSSKELSNTAVAALSSVPVLAEPGKRPIEATAPAGPALATLPAVSAAQSAETAEWELSVVSGLERHKRYPSAALSAGLSDSLLLRLIIDRRGRLLAAELARSHGIASLDRAALAMAARASPFPAPPSSVSGEVIRLLVPVEFTAVRAK